MLAQTTIENKPELPTSGLGKEVINPSKCSKGEEIVRQTLEEHYKVPFSTVRPDFLKYPKTGCNLELECYNKELNIAVEYNGIQHYTWPNYTGQSEEAYTKQQLKDKYKVDTCNKLGLFLIVVPYKVSHEMIPSYIIDSLPSSK